MTERNEESFDMEQLPQILAEILYGLATSIPEDRPALKTPGDWESKTPPVTEITQSDKQ